MVSRIVKGVRPPLMAICGSGAILIAQPAGAQPSVDPATSQADPDAAQPVPEVVGDKQVYTPEDFVRFAPRTARDMLDQVPGFTVRADEQGRGLGQASENVLLNGERVPSKAGGAAAQLQRLAANQVQRIEIVDAASLGIPGLSGLVANVVTTTESRASGQFAWLPELRPVVGRPHFLRGEVSYSGTMGAIEYSVGLEEFSGLAGSNGDIVIIDPIGIPFETRDEDVFSREFSPKASGRITWKGSGSIIANANGSFEFDRRRTSETTDRRRIDLADSSRSVGSRRKRWILDLGGDLAVPLGGGRLKTIALTAMRSTLLDNAAISTFLDGSPRNGERIDSDEFTREIVGRFEYDWRWGSSDLQLAGEAAFNSLDSTSRRFQLSAGDAFVEVPFVGGTGTVEEDRYEATASFGRPLGAGVSLRVTGGAEHSTLSALGVVRRFLRPKGSLSLGWQPDARTTVSAKLERVVGQLQFADFLASADLSLNTENAGNVDLVPPQSWEAQLEASRNLGAWGSTRLRLYLNLISDIVDTVPIGATGESLGNIDRARRYGLDWQSTVQFEPIGWTGGRLDALVRLQRSTVRDPLTGEQRAISSDLRSEFDVDLRHDVPGTPWAWGAGVLRRRVSPGFRLSQFSTSLDTPFDLSAFIEHKDVMGLTVRLSAANLAGQENRFERVVHERRRTEPVRFVESRDRRSGPTFNLDVRGSF